MSNILWKSFNLCFSKFKCFPTITFSQPPTNISDQQPPLFNNFNSLYDVNHSDNIISTSSSATVDATAATGDSFFTSSDEDSDFDSVPDFTSAFASHRFFFSSPGSSNSIIEQLEPPPQLDSGAAVSGGVAVETYSPDPFSDFRKSMVEMIEARDLKDGKADWEFLHELLLCYLTLNPKHTHKFILGAFADVVVSLMSPPPPPAEDARRKSYIRRTCATSRLSI
ncbi:hypothetical protein CDL12_26409 [Handroanthus impetiginosus]|uniref:Transcription repressor n=1 Tax=Handroanthus impetiginosus TaxID=429701 RepID=A0A2G9G6Z5_9LAMI|nr:hypothetical protein CDL12_26409 [Handroanthus impetiginosus]